MTRDLHAANLRAAAAAVGEAAAREARRNGPPNAVGEIVAGTLAGALVATGVEPRAATAVASALFDALTAFEGARVQLADADAARLGRRAAEEAARVENEAQAERSRRECAEQAARRAGRAWRDRGADVAHAVKRECAVGAAHQDLDTFVLAGWNQRDEELGGMPPAPPPHRYTT